MGSFEPKPFGKYFLTDRLAMGGMAEIYKAKTFGVDGFEKTLAIKKILPHYSADKEFIAMLTDEAKLVVCLSHTNIVQIYDLGKIGDDYYISMEHIDGVNLREVINRGKELQEKIPLPVCLFIISEISKGLDYAHSKRDDNGQPLHIVHRDISPQNILISFEGETKIVDFGIAKAAMNISHTTSGILKGKVTYMSPEQALGKPVDGRTDIFSTGLLLFEMITGERLFSGDTQFEVLKKIRTTKITDILLKEHKVPDDIRPILAKALAYHASDRYQTAGDLQVALTKILYSQYSDFAPRQLAALIKKWFAPELQQKNNQRKQETEIDNHTKSILLEANGQKSLVQHSSRQEHTASLMQDTTKPEDGITADQLDHREIQRVDQAESKSNHDNTHSQSILERQPYSKKAIIGTIIGFVVIALGVILLNHYTKKAPPPPPSNESGQIDISSEPPGAMVIINGENTGEKTPTIITELELEKEYTVHLEKEQFEPWEKKIFLKDSNIIVLKSNLIPIEEKGIIELTSDPTEATITLNGNKIEAKTPTTLKDLELGTGHSITLSKEGYKPITQEITLKDTQPFNFQTKLEPIVYGTLSIESDPKDAQIFLNGSPTGFTTPYQITEVEIPNHFQILLKKDKYKDYEQEIDLTSEAPLKLQANLQLLEIYQTADLSLIVNVSNFEVSINGQKYKQGQNNFNLKAGPAQIEVSKPGYVTAQQKITLNPGDKQEIRLTLQQEKSVPDTPQDGTLANLSIDSDPRGASVYIDGKKKGKTPLHTQLQTGSHQIRLKKDGYQAYDESIQVSAGTSQKMSARLQTDSQPIFTTGKAEVRIDSTPRAAAVLFNGNKAGITPVVIPNIEKDSSNTIVLSLPGYKKWTKSFKMKQNHVEFMANMKKE